jgi:molybdopterin molybdotransferase
MISYNQALQLTLDHIQPLGTKEIDISQAVGRVAGEDLVGLVDLPSSDVSLKDGYAIKSGDVVNASNEKPVSLNLIGDLAAGGSWEGEVASGEAVRILSGALIPKGAEAVVSQEFTILDSKNMTVEVMADAHPGRNILAKGSDVQQGQHLVFAGEILNPSRVGLLAAAGYTQIPVRNLPKVGIIATGDEVVAPGTPLEKGMLYASNLVTLAAWCHQYRMQVTTWVVKDEPVSLRKRLLKSILDHDVLLTSGGAWKGDRDLVVAILDELGWEKFYHRVRIGPGKAVGFGRLKNKPVFCLPGGPPSNYMAFLNLALPGLLRLSGYLRPSLPAVPARLAREVYGQIDWTQFVQGIIEPGERTLTFQPLRMESRLQMMALADGILTIPEGIDHIAEGEIVSVQVLDSAK